MILEPANVAGDLAHICGRSQGAGTLAETTSCAFGHFFNHLTRLSFRFRAAPQTGLYWRRLAGSSQPGASMGSSGRTWKPMMKFVSKLREWRRAANRRRTLDELH